MGELRTYLDASDNERGEAVPTYISPADPSNGGLTGPYAPNSTLTDPYRRRSYSLNYSSRIGVAGGHYDGRRIETINVSKMIFAANHDVFSLGEYGTLGLDSNNIRNLNAIPTDWHGTKGYAHFVYFDGHVEMLAIVDVMPDGDRFEDWESFN